MVPLASLSCSGCADTLSLINRSWEIQLKRIGRNLNKKYNHMLTSFTSGKISSSAWCWGSSFLSQNKTWNLVQLGLVRLTNVFIKGNLSGKIFMQKETKITRPTILWHARLLKVINHKEQRVTKKNQKKNCLTWHKNEPKLFFSEKDKKGPTNLFTNLLDPILQWEGI